MTPQIAVWISSLVGAVLFLGAGYFLARFRLIGETAGLKEAREQALQGLRGELEAERKEHSRTAERSRDLEQAKAQLTGQQSALESQLQEARRACQALEASAVSLRSECKALEDQKAELSQQLAGSSSKMKELERTLTEAMTRFGASQRLLASQEEDLAVLKESLKQAEAEREVLRAQTEAAEVDEEEGRTVLVVDERALQERIKSLQLELGRSRARSEELKQTIKELDSERNSLKARVEELEADNKALGARARRWEEDMTRNDAIREQEQFRLEAEKKTLEAERQSLEAERQSLEAGLRSLKSEVDEAKQRLAENDNKLARVSELEEERYRLKDEIVELKQKIASLSQLEPLVDRCRDLSLRVEVLKQQESLAATLAEQKAELAQRFREATGEIASLQASLEALELAVSDRQEMAIQLQVLNEQMGNLQTLREKNAELEALAAEVPHLRASVAELRVENTHLQSRGLVQESPPRPVYSGEREGLGQSLQGFLELLFQDERTRGVALADEQGLLVAGIGEHTEGLAALSSILDDIAFKAGRALPLSTPQHLAVADENDLTFAVQPFSISTGRLILATLSVGSGPDRSTVDQLVRQTAI